MNSWSYIFGIATALILGDIGTYLIVERMWDYLRIRYPRSKNKYLVTYHGQGRLVGIVERSIYYGAVLSGEPLVISVWFTLKTISQSPRWGKDKGPIQGRGIFQPFLVGSGLSLLFAIGGAFITTLLESSKATIASFVALALLFIWFYCYLITIWANWRLNQEKKEAIRKRNKRKSGSRKK